MMDDGGDVGGDVELSWLSAIIKGLGHKTSNIKYHVLNYDVGPELIMGEEGENCAKALNLLGPMLDRGLDCSGMVNTGGVQ